MLQSKTRFATLFFVFGFLFPQIGIAQLLPGDRLATTPVETRVLAESFARRLDAAMVVPDEIAGLADLKELLNSSVLKKEELQTSLGSVGELKKYLLKHSPLVSTRFCELLRLDRARCEEFDCLTDPEAKVARTAENPRLCRTVFSGEGAMPIEASAFAEWAKGRVQQTDEAKWQQSRAEWTNNGEFQFPIRQSGVAIRSLLSTYEPILVGSINILRDVSQKGSTSLPDVLGDILMRAEADRRLVEAAASVVDEISADGALAAVLLGATAPQLRAHALRIVEGIEGHPYALLQPTEEQRRASATLKGAIDGLRERLARIQSESEKAVAAARLASASRPAPAQQCTANPLLVPLVHDGPVRLLLEIGNLAGRDQGEARLLFAREVESQININTAEDEKVVPNCKDADFLARPLRLIDAGVALPVKRVGPPGAQTFALVEQSANLDIGVDEGVLTPALQGLGVLPPFLRFSKPRLILSDLNLKSISVEFSVSMPGLGLSSIRTGTLVKNGRLDAAAFIAEIANMQAIRTAATEHFAGNRGLLSLGGSVQLTNVSAIGDWVNGPRIRGTLAIANLPPVETELVLAPDDAGNWSLTTASDLPALRNEVLRRLLDQGPVANGLRQIAALKDGADDAAKLVRQHLSVANIRLLTARRLVFDLHIDLPGSPISLPEQVLDPNNLPSTLVAVAQKVATSIANEYKAAMEIFVRTMTAALFNAAAAEFDGLVTKVDGTKFSLFGLDATLQIDKAGRPRPVRIRVEADGGAVIIQGLRLTGFTGDPASPLPRLEGTAEISQSDRSRLQLALTAKLTNLVGLNWLEAGPATIALKGTVLEASIRATGVPLIGTFDFPVVGLDLRDGSTRFDPSAVKSRLRDALAARLSPEITARFQEILPEEFRSIVRRIDTMFRGDNFVASGKFAFSGVKGTIDVTLAVNAGRFVPTVELEYEPDLLGIIQSAVGQLLGGGKIAIQDKSTKRPYLKLDIKDVPIAGDTFQVSAFGVAFTPKGVEIDGLGLVIPVDIPIPPAIVISRPRVTVVFRGARSFSVGGDITILRTGEAFRIEGVLTGKIDELVIELDGKVVLLTVLPLFETNGRTEFKTGIITTRSRSVGLLKALFPTDTNTKFDAKAGLLTFDTKATLLGIHVKGGGVVDTGIRAKDGVKAEVGKAGLTLRGDLTAPFGDLTGGFSSDPFMLKPAAYAKGSINILGVKTGLDLDVDYGSANLTMGLLGFTVRVIAPGPKSLTPNFLEGIVRNLLKPSFDLNAIKRRDIVISLIPPGADRDRPPPGAPPVNAPPANNPNQNVASPPSPASPPTQAVQPAPAPATGGPPPQPLPAETYIIQPARGVSTGWVDAYTRYPEVPEYYCKARLKLGAKEKPSCIGAIVSKSIADLLKDPGVRSLDIGKAIVPFEAGVCRNGTKCEEPEVDREAEIQVWIKTDHSLVGFAESHKGTPHALAGSPTLSSVLGANPSVALRDQITRGQPSAVVQKLIGYDAEPVVLANADLGLKSAHSLFKGSTAWIVQHTTSNSRVRGNALVHLVDPRENLIATLNAGGLREFLLAFAATAPDDHGLRPLLLGELRSTGKLETLWADKASVLLIEEGFVRLAQVNNLGPRINLDPRSKAERHPITDAPAFDRPSLQAGLSGFLSSDPSWQKVRIDNAARAAVLGESVGESTWRIGLVLWNDETKRVRQAKLTAQQVQARLSCWKSKGWLREDLAKRLEQAKEAGSIFVDALMMQMRQYVDAGFLVSPRLFLEEC